jgi:photosystem II stability/assembly factor-like uncharacterized protein
MIKRGLLTIRRHPTPIMGGITLALIVGLIIGMNWAGRSSPSQTAVRVNSQPISAMHFFSPDAGWVLTGSRLLTTRDRGTHWRDITPGPREPPIQLSDARFLDAAHGWTGAVGGFGTKAVQIFRTPDGGTTWQSSQVMVDQPLGITFDFVDPQHGWLVVATQASSNFARFGQLFQTADGGATWSALPPPPSGHPVRFISLSTGWIVGGANFDQLYVTRDGGQSWQQQRVPVPAVYADTSALDLPAFVDSRLGVLPVKFADGSVQLDFSVDGGATWAIDATRAPLFIRQPPYARYEAPTPPIFVGNGVMAVALGTELKLHAGGIWSSVKPRGFDSVYEIEFVNPRVGWAVSSHFGCEGSGAAARCNSRQDLLRSDDGGRSWTAVPVRYSS